jgi:hypothetical protein
MSMPPEDRTLSVREMQNGIGRLGRRIEELKAFDPQSVSARRSPNLVSLETAVEDALAAVFGQATPKFKRYRSACDLEPAHVPRLSTPSWIAARGGGGGYEGEDLGKLRAGIADRQRQSIALLDQAVRGLHEEIQHNPSDAVSEISNAERGTADQGYLERALCRIADEAVLEAQVAVKDIQTDWTLKKALGNSRIYLAYNDAIAAVFQRAVRKMAVSAFNIAGEHSFETGAAIRRAADCGFSQIVECMKRKAVAAGAFGPQDPLLDQLTAALYKIRDGAVDDFVHGMVGGTPLKKPAPTSAGPAIINSPGAVQQNVYGNQNQLLVQQKVAPLLDAIRDILASDEFSRLSAEQQTEIRDHANALHSELTKPHPDMSVANRWRTRLIKLARDFGLALAAHALTKAVLG